MNEPKVVVTPKWAPFDSEALGTKTVTLYVGPKRKEFTFHRKLLCDKSDFFSKAFNTTSNFKESREGVMYLPQDNSDAFEALVNWIYRHQVPSPNTLSDEAKAGPGHRALLFNTYVLAEKYCMLEFANRLLDTLQDCAWNDDVCHHAGNIKLAYKNTHKDSSLRRYCTAIVVRSLLSHKKGQPYYGSLWKILEKLPDLALDVARFQLEFHSQLAATEPRIDPRLRSERGYGRCFFHSHSESDICYLEDGQ